MIALPVRQGESTEELAAKFSAAAEGLVQLNLVEMGGREFPPLLQSGLVSYRREAVGKELWSSVSIVFARGYGDCEDLSAIVAAEARRAGKQARVVVRPSRSGRGFHAVVEVDGRRYDPSKALMRRGLWLPQEGRKNGI